MYQALLVPLDGSPESEQALPLACAIARRTEAALRLVSVHEPTNPLLAGAPAGAFPAAAFEERERAYLERLREQLPADLAITCVNLEADGSIAATLAQYAMVAGVDLVVMTTHGWGGLARLWLGSVADALVRRSAVPLLLLRPNLPARLDPAHPPDIRQMFIPLDGSTLAEQILEPALELGRALGAEYTLLHVVEPFRLYGPAPFTEAIDLDVERTKRRQAEQQTYLERVAGHLRAEGLRVRTRVLVSAQPAVAILEAAREREGGLIALATHGRSGLVRLIVGSVADKVLRGAGGPVLLYRPRERDSEE